VFSAAVCLVIGWALLSDPAASAAVIFPDPNLEAVIREAINRPTGDIEESDLLGITYLEGSGRGITDLTGLEYCVNLDELRPYDNQIVELLPLAGLTKLRTLILARNHIADLSPLAGLTDLTWLNLDENTIENVSPLAGLTNLRLLELAHNQISDARPLAGISSLYQLNLSYNAIGSASQLDGLVLSGSGQCTLLLHHNPLTNFAGTSHVSMLGEEGNILDASFCQINDLTGIGQFISSANRLTLELNDNEITAVDPLNSVAHLRSVILCNNPLSDNAAFEQIQALRQMGIYVQYGLDCVKDQNRTDNLIPVGHLEFPFGGVVAVADGLLYAAVDSYLAIADIYSISEPVELGMAPSSGSPVDIAVSGALASVVSADRVYPSALGYLQTYDVSNPIFPELVGTFIDGGEPVSVTACGHYAYVAWKDAGSSAEASSSLRVFDIEGRFSPRQVACYEVPHVAYDLVVENCIAYVGYVADGYAGRPGGVLILDVTHPRRPEFLGLYESGYGTQTLDVSDGILCRLTTGSWGQPLPMDIVDVSNPAAPSHLSYYFTVNGTDVALSRGIAYVVSGVLSVYDLRDPLEPMFVGFDHGAHGGNLRVVDDLVYMGASYEITVDQYTGPLSAQPEPSGCGCPSDREDEDNGRLECAGPDITREASSTSLLSDFLLLAAVVAFLLYPRRRIPH
jgi:hypothetical protein